MPNLVNEILYDGLRADFKAMGSCVVLQFDKLQPQQDVELRGLLRNAGVRYRVVRNRLAAKAFRDMDLDLGEALVGKCGVAIAEKERAIAAAKVVRDFIKKTKNPPVQIVGGVVEGTAYVGAAAQAIADLPDRHTVNTMVVSAISGPARSLATIFAAVASGMARCIQAKVDKHASGESAGAAASDAPAA